LTKKHLEAAGAKIVEAEVNRTQRSGQPGSPGRVSRRTRPDFQLAIIDAKLQGKRVVIEYDRAPATRAMKHARGILEKDPTAIVILKVVGYD